MERDAVNMREPRSWRLLFAVLRSARRPWDKSVAWRDTFWAIDHETFKDWPFYRDLRVRAELAREA